MLEHVEERDQIVPERELRREETVERRGLVRPPKILRFGGCPSSGSDSSAVGPAGGLAGGGGFGRRGGAGSSTPLSRLLI